jgi:hypothetical protein
MHNGALFIGRFDTDPAFGKCMIADGDNQVALPKCEILVN